MPIYEYQCEQCKHRFEKLQKFSDKPCKKCPNCSGPLRKLVSSPAIQFKGEGFYINDYAKKSGSSTGGKSKAGDPDQDKAPAAKAGESRRKPRRPRPFPPTSPARTRSPRPAMRIVVRVPNWIGDVMFALPALESLKANYPGAEIRLAGAPWVSDLLAGETWGEHVLPIGPAKGLRGLRAAARGLRAERFDLGLLLTNSFGSAALFALAKIPGRWGYRRDGRGFLLTKGLRPEGDRPSPAHGPLLPPAPRRAGPAHAPSGDPSRRKGGGARGGRAVLEARGISIRPAARRPQPRGGLRSRQALAGRPFRRARPPFSGAPGGRHRRRNGGGRRPRRGDRRDALPEGRRSHRPDKSPRPARGHEPGRGGRDQRHRADAHGQRPACPGGARIRADRSTATAPFHSPPPS